MSSDYWFIPEDISHSWAALRTYFERQARAQGNKQITVGCVSQDGVMVSVLECRQARVIEPVPLASCTTARPLSWWGVIRRLRSVAGSYGTVVVETDVMLNGKGEPLFWTAPVCRQLEPRRRVES